MHRRRKHAKIMSQILLQMLIFSTLQLPKEIWTKPRSVYRQCTCKASMNIDPGNPRQASKKNILAIPANVSSLEICT